MSTQDNVPILLIIGCTLLLTMYYLFGTSSPICNDGKLATSKNNQKSETYMDDGNSSEESSVTYSQQQSDDSVDSSLEEIKKRSMGLNNIHFRKEKGDKYNPQNYYKNNRYNAINSGDLNNSQFSVSDVTKNYNDQFQPIDESGDEYSPINIPKKKDTEKDKYNVDSFLPKEHNKDWFETIETVDVKNTHLINIYRPIGSNTIGNSHKNATYDIRGTGDAICPQYTVGPWNQSTIPPDRSLKKLC